MKTNSNESSIENEIVNNDSIYETINNPIFKTVDELREYLCDQGYEETAFFENPSFVTAITGISDSGQLIYDYNLMIASAMEEEKWDIDEAVDWIEYNTIRSIPYMGNAHPIVSFPIEW